MWKLDRKTGWALKNRRFWTVVLEKTTESPLDNKEIKLVNSKGDQSWILIGRTDAEPEAPILSLPDAKNWLIGKDPDAGRDWRQEEKGTTENEMVGWHHRLEGHEFEEAPGVGDGQGSLVCCSPCGHEELSTTNDWTELILSQKGIWHTQRCRDGFKSPSKDQKVGGGTNPRTLYHFLQNHWNNPPTH